MTTSGGVPAIFGDVEAELAKVIAAVDTANSFLQGPLGSLVPAGIKTAVADLANLLDGANTFLHITPA